MSQQQAAISMMELYIETLTGVLMELMVHPYETVYNVKAKINKLEGFPISEQHLIWQAVELDNERSLQHYRIPDGATLRLVLNMRGGPINTRRVPLEESSLREMAEYFSDPVGDDPTSGDHPVTVIVYQQGEHINFFRLVDRDASSSLSYSLSGGSDYNGEEDSPIPKEREDENEKTRNKMKMLKEQMESLTIAKEKKQLTKRPRVPRPPSSSRPQSRTKLRHISVGGSGKQTGILNKNCRLPAVGQSVPQHDESPLEKSETSLPLYALTSDSGSTSKATHSESSVLFPLQQQRQQQEQGQQQQQTVVVTADRQMKHCGSFMDSTLYTAVSFDATSTQREAGDSLSSASLASNACQSEVENIMLGKSDSPSPSNQQPIISAANRSDQSVAKTSLESTAAGNDKKTMAVHDAEENVGRDRPIKSDGKTADGGPAPSLIGVRESVPDSAVPTNTTSIPPTESTTLPFGPGSQWRPTSMKGGRAIAAPVVPHPPAPPPPPPRYLPFAPGTGGRLLQHRHPPDVAKDGGGLPPEAVLGYLMSPTRRTGVERKSGGVTLQSLNHKEVRAVSGMLRSIVRSANRSQAGYLMPNRKLTQLPASPTHEADVPIDDPSNILRVLSGSREGRVTPVRFRLPSVKVTKKKSTKRCGVCRKRTKLATGFQCRCGENFCLVHLCAEAHGCTYDYKAEGRKLIEQSNPVVTAPKLPKI